MTVPPCNAFNYCVSRVTKIIEIKGIVSDTKLEVGYRRLSIDNSHLRESDRFPRSNVRYSGSFAKKCFRICAIHFFLFRNFCLFAKQRFVKIFHEQYWLLILTKPKSHTRVSFRQIENLQKWKTKVECARAGFHASAAFNWTSGASYSGKSLSTFTAYFRQPVRESAREDEHWRANNGCH